jgi:fibronectin type 3 domain-containing protein
MNKSIRRHCLPSARLAKLVQLQGALDLLRRFRNNAVFGTVTLFIAGTLSWVYPVMLSAAPTINYVQSNYATPQANETNTTVPFTSAQTAGDLNVVVVGWASSASTITSVTDKSGNSYTLAVGPTLVSGYVYQSIYYAKNIKAAAAGANAVTVNFSPAALGPDIRILEYSGADPTNPVDVTAASTGSSGTSSTSAATTTNATDLIFGANMVWTYTAGPGNGFTERMITSPDGDIAEDRTVTSAGSYSAAATLSSSGPWVMQMVAFRTPQTQPPSTPSSLTATAASTTQINLSWTASTSSVGVANYIVQRCQGAGCSNFTQIGTPTATTYSDTGLTSNTSYSYRVQTKDTMGSLSGYSNTASATTQAATLSTITFVQGNYATPQANEANTTVPFTSAQTAGDLNVVVVGWASSASTITSITDKSGNSYTLAVGPTLVSGYVYQSIYYAKNIRAAAVGANAVTVNFSPAAPAPDIRILEYSGADPTNPVDVTAAGTGSSGSSSTSAATTTNASDLIFGANMVWTYTTGPGSGFTERMITSPDGDIGEDKMVSTTGSYSATAPLSSSGPWVMQMVAFRSASTGSKPVSAPVPTPVLSASPSSLSFGNVTLNTTSTLPVVVSDTGTASVTISQATATGAGFGVSGLALPFTLSAGQTASFSVTFDPTTAGAVTGNLSILSNATDSPNVTSLSGTGVNSHSVTLSWVASTSSNIAGYDVYRATVSGGPYTQINSSVIPGLTYTDTAVQAGQTYYYVTTAVNSAGVQSSYSNQVSAVIP